MVEWIEIANEYRKLIELEGSPPSWWSGLKYPFHLPNNVINRVSTLVVEWIEIPVLRKHRRKIFVSTLVVEWIEINNHVIVEVA